MTVPVNAPAWCNAPDRDRHGWSLAHTYVEDPDEPGVGIPIPKMLFRDIDHRGPESAALAADIDLGHIRCEMLPGDLGLAV